MLVLSRKPDESIMLGEDIIITVVRIGQNSVKIGITAPASVSVHRSEVLLQIRDERAVRENQEGGKAC